MFGSAPVPNAVASHAQSWNWLNRLITGNGGTAQTEPRLEGGDDTTAPVGRVEVPVVGAPGRSFTFEYRLWSKGSGACR